MTEYPKEHLERIIKESFSKADFLRKLNIKPSGANYKWFDKIAKKHNLDKSHFTGQGWSFGKKLGISNRSKPLKEILVEDSPFSNSNCLKKRLLKEGVKQYKCEKCLNSIWNNESIPLELEHCNGISTDNRIENLKLLCPNCHAQTAFYRGRNIFSARNKKRESNFITFSKEKALSSKEKTEVKKQIKQEPKTCKCGKTISLHALQCRECDYLNRKTSRPAYNQLVEDFKQLKNFVQVGKKYNVSDNAVRKWLKVYRIDFSEIKKLIEEIDEFPIDKGQALS